MGVSLSAQQQTAVQGLVVMISSRKIDLYAVSIIVTVLIISILWSFALEDVLDPFLPGEHVEENRAEKIEFVFLSALFVTLAVTGPTLLAKKSLYNWKVAEEKQRLFFFVVQETTEAVMITDMKGNISSVNPAFTQITGYPAAEVIGKNPRFLSSGQHDQPFYETMWSALRENNRWRGELWNRKCNGELYAQQVAISLVKDPDLDSSHYVAVFHDITHLKEQEKRLRFDAQHDQLTGLPNRSLFFDRLTQCLTNTRTNHNKSAVLFVDLDKFKPVNDTYGHVVGDQLLKMVANNMVQSVRAEDTVARMGGDEFTVILRNVSQKEDAGVLANKLIDLLSTPFTIENQAIQIGASIGIAIFPEDGNTMEQLLEKADVAMYTAKNAGRNQFRYAANNDEITADKITI